MEFLPKYSIEFLEDLLFNSRIIRSIYSELPVGVLLVIVSLEMLPQIVPKVLSGICKKSALSNFRISSINERMKFMRICPFKLLQIPDVSPGNTSGIRAGVFFSGIPSEFFLGKFF